jgi:glycosyltransferase involved in cell wall biosynthesis
VTVARPASWCERHNSLSPRCAILIPTYNSERTVAETLESVQSQSSLDRIGTVILCDDASTDNTLSVARAAWNSRTTGFRMVERQKNAGERTNLNEAIAALEGQFDWIFILHSDDVAKPHWLELMLDRINAASDRVASICSSWDDWMPDGTLVPGEDQPGRPVELIEGSAASVRRTIEKGCWWHISGCAIRVSAFRQIGAFGPELPQLGDWEWLLRLLTGGWHVEYIPRTLIQYRNHCASVSSVSFRTDRDIRESLVIVPRYRPLLRRRDILSFHGRRLQFCVRRFARAAKDRNATRLKEVTRTTSLVVKSLARSLWPTTCL